mgnify:CR=1 FL=1
MKKQTNKKYKIDFLKGTLLFDKVLVKPISVEVSDSGLATAEQYEDKPEFGIVEMVGEGILLDNGNVIPLKFKKGDIVFFEKYSGKKVRINGEDYSMLRADDIEWFTSSTSSK